MRTREEISAYVKNRLVPADLYLVWTRGFFGKRKIQMICSSLDGLVEQLYQRQEDFDPLFGVELESWNFDDPQTP